MTFASPLNLVWLALFIPLILFVYIYRRRHGRVKFSTLKNLKPLKPSASLGARHALIALRALAVSLFIIALARPQKGLEGTKIETEGVDIMLAVDVSGSMMAEDFVMNRERLNRLAVVKAVVRDFIERRANDRIGLVVFAGRAYMQCPLTLDHGVLLKFLDRIQIGMLEDGTAVGDGIATALASISKIKAKSKLIILLTDGVNNAGRVDPENAAELARATGVKIYTIGAGSKGRVPYPVEDMFGNKVYQWARIDLDEDSLRGIAETTGGRYFRALDTESLRKIYGEIDRMEKRKDESKIYQDYRELFPPFVLAGLVLILIEIVLRNTRFRTLP